MFVSLWLQFVPRVQQQGYSRRCRGIDQGLPGSWGSVCARVLVARPCGSLQSFRACVLHGPAEWDQGERSAGRCYEDSSEQQAVLTPLQLGRLELHSLMS